MTVRYDLRSGNAAAFNSKDPEILLASAAGTGKSLALCLKVFTLCSKYPNARCLIVRKTRESLTESVLVTLERDVMAPGTPGHHILKKRPTLRRIRQSYDFPNGSSIVVAGLDKPDKILSSEWDAIYVPEATDLNVIDWETLGGRLRAGKVPFQQLMGDANPTSPQNFLYRRFQSGTLKMFTSTHKDNPRFFDDKTGEWTDDGRKYLARLNLMTGARRKRFLEGVWVAAEGLVFEEYDPAKHLLPEGWRCPHDWRRVWSIDWGKNAPSVLQVWAIDSDGRMHLAREIYLPRQRGSDLGKAARRMIDFEHEPEPLAVLCDHDDEKKNTFEAESHLSLTFADKTDRDAGFGQVSDRLDPSNDGQPRMFFARDARRHPPDVGLLNEGKPTSTLDEIVGYIWETKNAASGKDEPISYNDHGMDAMRYATRYVDSHLTDRGSDGGYGTPASDGGSGSGGGW